MREHEGPEFKAGQDQQHVSPQSVFGLLSMFCSRHSRVLHFTVGLCCELSSCEKITLKRSMLVWASTLWMTATGQSLGEFRRTA